MSDGNLLVFGCAVSFIAIAGTYVFLRERYDAYEARQLSRQKRHRGDVSDAA